MYIVNKKNTFIKKDNIIVIIYAVCLCILHIIRIFDNNFWGDEAFTINTVNESFFDMIKITAADVHPPLYYVIVKILCEILGYNGIVYHLASVLPYCILIFLGISIIWKWFGREAAIIFISFASLLSTSLQMIVEVRMYTWGGLVCNIKFFSLV